MRAPPVVLLTAALLSGCGSTPFPPAANSITTPPAVVAEHRPTPQLQIVPLPGQPGFQVCADCPGARPTPKTLAGVPAPTATTAPAQAVPAAATPPATVRYAASIPFAFNSSRIDGAGQDALAAFASRLPAGARTNLVSVSGRTDSIGPRAANVRIARARAQAVLAALRARLQPQSFEIRAEPLCCYIASNATAAGRADNRRVDVVALLALE